MVTGDLCCISLFSSDLGRYLVLGKKRTPMARLRLILMTPGIWVLFHYRMGRAVGDLGRRTFILKPASMIYNYFYFWLCLFTGIDLPLDTTVGKGLYIGHWGGITIHPQTIMGNFCNISQGVTIGEGGRQGKRGVPRLGDRVYIGPGAKIFGDIDIGNDVAIGANAVVSKSVPDTAVVGGIPAEILSLSGSKDFVII